MIYKDGREREKLSNPSIFKLAYDGSDNLEYVGTASPNSATSEAKWKIMKMTYTGSNMQDVLYADNGNFTQIWDNRAALSYA